MKACEIITPDDEEDIAEESAMSPCEKWEADYEASRSHIGKAKEETMNREQLVKYVGHLKSMIANLQTANAGLSAEAKKYLMLWDMATKELETLKFGQVTTEGAA